MRAQLVLLELLFIFSMALSQNSRALDEKVKTLQGVLTKKPYISLNYDKWRTLVRSQPRNYSVIAMFTALGTDFNCALCQPAHEEFTIAANSYRYTHLHTKQVYFALIDYENNPQAFQQMNLNTAPVVMHFPARGSAQRQDQMDLQRHGFGAEAVAKFVQERTDVQIRIIRPPNYAGPIVVVLLIMLILGMLYMRRDNIDFIYSNKFWGVLSVILSVAFMSGQMWNHIRSPPFVMTNPQTRQTSFVHGSTQFQLISETYIVFVLYSLISAGIVFLNDSVNPESKESPSKKKWYCYIGLGMVVIFFSLLLSVFRMKYSGYPYYFLFH